AAALADQADDDLHRARRRDDAALRHLRRSGPRERPVLRPLSPQAAQRRGAGRRAGRAAVEAQRRLAALTRSFAMATPRPVPSTALRHARRAWNLLHVDSSRARVLAALAIDAATRSADTMAEGWARMALGYHMLYYATAAEAAVELHRARACFEASGDRAGHLLAGAAIARSMWRQGRVNEALA